MSSDCHLSEVLGNHWWSLLGLGMEVAQHWQGK